MSSLLTAYVDAVGVSRPSRLLLQGFELELCAGELVAVTGESGAGKSLLGRLLTGGLRSEAGLEARYSLSCEDRAWPGGERLPAGFVGLVGGDPRSQIVGSTLLEDVAFGPGCFQVEPLETRRRCAAALEAVGLAGFESRHPETLSGGEAQRAALAAALVLEPPVLVLDEALSELDPDGRRRALRLLRAHADSGAAVVLITSDDSEVAGSADRIVRLAAPRTPGDSLAEAGDDSAPALPPIGHWVGLSASSAGEFAIEVSGATLGFCTGGGCFDADLGVRPGELVGLVGPNGSGKTTLARLILGLARPQQGALTTLGEPPSGRGGAALRRRLAVVPQDPDLRVCRPSLLEETALDAEIRGLSRAQAHSWAAEVLRSVGLEPWAEEHPLRLSRGQRRLVTVAAACSLGAAVILADEPTAGLSPFQAARVYGALRACADSGAAVLVISHHHDRLRSVADRVAWMEGGRVIQLEELGLAGGAGAGAAPPATGPPRTTSGGPASPMPAGVARAVSSAPTVPSSPGVVRASSA